MALMYLLVGIVFDSRYPIKVLSYPINIIGAGIALAGFALMFWAFKIFSKKGTPKDPKKVPTTVVTSGPFRITRNPMYIGMILIMLGVASMIGLLVFLAPIAFFIRMNFIYIPQEEKLMEKLFGQEYLNFKTKVRRWI